MFKRLPKLLVILMGLFLLSGCGMIEEIIDDIGLIEADEPSILAIDDLKETKYFRKGALEHILEGELNGRGHAVGFHYDGLPTQKGEIISGTETDPNEYGVYEAKVEVSGVSKTSNGGKSTFFPEKWTAQDVVDAINEAYEARSFKVGNTYEGLTKEGLIIQMYLDQNEEIISAFPVY